MNLCAGRGGELRPARFSESYGSMPWTAGDAQAKTHKASTPKKRRQWSAVANSVLARGASEGSAIRQANAVVARGASGLRTAKMPTRKR